MSDALRTLIAPLASLRLAIVTLCLLMALIFFGTLAQTTHGIWFVMDQYFTSWYVRVPLSIFTPGMSGTPGIPGTARPLPGAFPFPGGATLGLVLLINLVAAHTTRYKLKARGVRLATGLGVLAMGVALIVYFHAAHLPGTLKAMIGLGPMLAVGAAVYAPTAVGVALLYGRRVGIVLIHGSIILLIVGEGVTRAEAVETSMPIYVGESLSWSQDMRTTELAVIDPTDPDRDRVTAIPQPLLREAHQTGEPISHPDLPFDIRVDEYHVNSTFRPRGPMVEPAPPDLRGLGRQYVLEPQPQATGVGNQMYNFPGMRVTLLRDGRPLGRYDLSAITAFMGNTPGSAYKSIRQDVQVDDQTWQFDLRFKRHYKPYTIELIEFHHDLYPGTQVPSNYASDIRLIDHEAGTQREVHIRMNQPLRYEGETFFQSGYIRGDLGTVLQVVDNPGWTIPYIACTLGGAGLVIHFVLSLGRFLGRGRGDARGRAA